MKSLLTLFSYAKNLWPYYVGAIIFSVLVATTGLATPFFVKEATDLVASMLQGGDATVQAALWIAIGLLIADILNSLFTNIGGYIGDVMGERLKKQLSEKYYKHLLQLPQSYYDTELTGTIINRLNRSIVETTQFIQMFVNNFFQMYLTTLIILVIVAVYSVWLALLLLLLYPTFLYLTAKTSKKWVTYQDAKNKDHDIATGRFAEVVAQVRVVKAFLREPREIALFTKRFDSIIDTTRQQSRYWHNMDMLRRMVLNIILFLVYAYLFVATIDGTYTLGEMVLIVQLVAMLRMPIFMMSFVVDNMQKAIAGSKDYIKVIQTQPEVADVSDARTLTDIKGDIVFDAVGFSYDDDKAVLKNISFDVKHGKKIALVGQSGSGKTTITSLLLRLYNVDKGRILIDGNDIAEMTQASVRRAMSVVFQEPALFSGTIAENIAYGQPKAAKKQLEQAARDANAYDFIMEFEDGFDTVIGERGLKLSGGQKQRIAIARALLSDAPILILDEATSSLDTKAEREVQQALDRLMKNRTTIIVAHRLSTIAEVDTIVTLKKGKVDEIGSPKKLAKTGGIYSELLALQNAATTEEKRKLKSYDMSA